MGLFGNKAPTAKFKKLGDQVSGEIVDFQQQQRTEYVPGKVGDPMFWHKGKPTAGMAVDPATGEPNRPVMDDVIVLETGVADEYGETERRLFIKGKQMLDGLKAACRDAGVRDLDTGGRLTCRWAEGAGGAADPRVYAFEYVPPGGVVRAPDRPAHAPEPKATGPATGVYADKKTPAAKTAKATTKAALGIKDDDEPPF